MDKPHLTMRGLWVILVLEYVFIFGVIFNYDLASFQGEKITSHSWVLSNGKQWRWEDFGRFLNTEVIELSGDRLSRPVSNFVEVLNAKFRANCWDLFPPHPSFSIMWFLSFIALPYFLFHFFRNMGCAAAVAFAGTCWYLASAGFLSPLAMLFHPAKGLVNLLGVLALFMGSKFHAHFAQNPGRCSVRDLRHGWFYAAGFFICLVLALFSDETAIFVYVMAAAFFVPLFWKLKERWLLAAGMLCLPVFYGWAIRWGLPALHFGLSGHANDLRHFVSYPRLMDLFLPNVKNLMTNFYWLLGDHPHLRCNLFAFRAFPHLFALQAAYTLAVAVLMYAFIRNFDKRRLRAIITCVLLALAFVFFHTFQLSNNARIWGVWWYGSLFSLVYALLLTFILQQAWEGSKTPLLRQWLLPVAAIMVCHALVFSTYRINYFKANSGPHFEGNPFKPTSVEQYKYYSFLDSLRRSRCKYLYTARQWARAKHKNAPSTPQGDACIAPLENDSVFKVETLYLSVEL
ncbi:MAG: hypothetical protein HY591_03910 [Candidatus Omnitrophica bacterium]|nr:hypothetical protein [Candidatus Omnitrophota bacterium]